MVVAARCVAGHVWVLEVVGHMCKDIENTSCAWGRAPESVEEKVQPGPDALGVPVGPGAGLATPETAVEMGVLRVCWVCWAGGPLA